MVDASFVHVVHEAVGKDSRPCDGESVVTDAQLLYQLHVSLPLPSFHVIKLIMC